MMQPHFHNKAFCILLGILGLDGASLLQAGKPIDQAQNSETSRNPEHARGLPGFSWLPGDAAPGSPGDKDLGEQRLLNYQEKEKPFILTGDSAGYATNNAGLTESGTHKDQFLVGQIAVGYQPAITGSLRAEFSFREAFFRYHRFSELDFDSQDMGAGLTYRPVNLWNISFYGRYNYNRLLDAKDENEIFTNHSLTIGAQKTFALSHAHYLYAGYASQFGIGHPRNAERNEHGAFVGYHVDLARALQGDLFYRIAGFDYAEGGRHDLNQTATGSFQYQLAKWLYLYASATFSINDSNRPLLSYKAFSPGAGLNATFKF